MSQEKERNGTPQRKDILNRLRTSDELYVLMSPCTKMPYVHCDEESLDDEVFLYSDEEAIKQGGARLAEQKIPIQAVKIENKQLLAFYTNLWTMGVNSILFQSGTPEEIRIQLNELILRPGTGKLPNGQIWVENPSLHLTALYFMQEVRRQKQPELTEETRQLQEEILADYEKGTYITVIHKENGIPLLKQKSGDAYQPFFTDVIELRKFDRNNEMKAVIVEAKKVPEVLAKNAKGVVINPAGVNLQLPIIRRPRAAESGASENMTDGDEAEKNE